jgi:hypothetical protein
MRLGRPSPAIVVAGLALVLASSGTTLAASRYLITSPSQIKPSVRRSLAEGSRPIEVKSQWAVKPGDQPAVQAAVVCPDGTHVISGGYTAELPPGMTVKTNHPTSNGWLATAYTGVDSSTPAPARLQAYALCAPGA